MEVRGKRKFHTIVIGGGGSKGLASVGSLHEVYRRKLLEPKRISGTSIGSVIGALLGIGMKPREIFNIALKAEKTLEGGNRAGVLTKYGIWSVSKSLKPFLIPIISHFGKSPTFKEYFEKTEIHLKICASNINNLEAVYFDHITHPEEKVINAIRASCCVPGVFKVVKINGDFHVDGGFVNNLPSDVWEGVDPREMLILSVSSASARANINSLLEYVSRVSLLAILTKIKTNMTLFPEATLVESIIEEAPLLPLALSNETKKEFFTRGVLDARVALSKFELSLP